MQTEPVQPQFRVSPSCGNGGCVAVAAIPGGVLVRDDKDPAGSPVLGFSTEAWNAFVADVRNGLVDVDTF